MQDKRGGKWEELGAKKDWSEKEEEYKEVEEGDGDYKEEKVVGKEENWCLMTTILFRVETVGNWRCKKMTTCWIFLQNGRNILSKLWWVFQTFSYNLISLKQWHSY